MANISGVIKTIRNYMRNDRGVNGDAQRLEQLGNDKKITSSTTGAKTIVPLR